MCMRIFQTIILSSRRLESEASSCDPVKFSDFYLIFHFFLLGYRVGGGFRLNRRIPPCHPLTISFPYINVGRASILNLVCFLFLSFKIPTYSGTIGHLKLIIISNNPLISNRLRRKQAFWMISFWERKILEVSHDSTVNKGHALYSEPNVAHFHSWLSTYLWFFATTADPFS